MGKLKVGVIFGGKSTEHDVSIVSGTSVIKNLNKEKYEVFPIYIDENGEWYIYNKDVNKIEILAVGEKITELTQIDNPMQYLKNIEVVFPVLHASVIGIISGSPYTVADELNTNFLTLYFFIVSNKTRHPETLLL